MPSHLLLEDRGLLRLDGPEAEGFLQGLVSNDVTRAGEAAVLYAALLSPQGRFLHDFFVARQGEALLLETAAARLGDLKRRLSLYRLRAKVGIADATAGWRVAALFGPGAAEAAGLEPRPGAARALDGGLAFVDPRLAALGCRLILPAEAAAATLAALGGEPAGAEAYEAWRLSLGVPEAGRDILPDQSILLESNLDALNAIAWDKGCYVGQELTARTRYRGLVKKRLMPVAVEGPLPPAGTRLVQDGREVGEMRSGRDGMGLALLRLDSLASAEPILAGEARLRPRKPDWLAL